MTSATIDLTSETPSAASSDRAPRLLILGGGAVVRDCYVPALRLLEWLSKSTVVDTDAQTLASVTASGAQVPELHRGDFESVLSDAEIVRRVDGVVVALPNGLHERAVIAALERRLPVLCEKPLALTAAGCRSIANASRSAQTPVMVGMVRRLLPAIAAMKRAIDSGMVGDVTALDIAHGGRFSWPADRGSYFVKANGGALLNMGIHYLDMAEYFLGPLQAVAYQDDSLGGVEANFRFQLCAPSGARVNLALSFTHALNNHIVLTGSRGRLEADVNVMDRCRWVLSSGLSGALSFNESHRAAPFEFVHAFEEQLNNFAGVISGRRRPDVRAEDAAQTHELIDWAERNRQPLRRTPKRSPGAERPTLSAGRAVVTGGTGFVGTALVRRLTELGFGDVVVPVRSFQSGAALGCMPVARERVDLLDPQAVEQCIAGSRYVFHLAYGADGPNAGRVTMAATKNVVEAAIKARAEAVVVTSTTAVFGHYTARGSVDERSPYRPDLGDYARSKAKAEQYCLQRATRTSSTRIVVLNPSFVYGPGAWLMVEYPARLAERNEFFWIDNGAGRLNVTFVENLVDALVLAASRPSAHGKRFIISDGTLTLREFLSAMLGSHVLNSPSFSTDEFRRLSDDAAGLRDLMRAALSREMIDVAKRLRGAEWLVRAIRDRVPSLHRQLKKSSGVDTIQLPADAGRAERSLRGMKWMGDFFGNMQLACSSEKARTELEWQPLVSVDEGVRLCGEWLTELQIVQDHSG